MIHLDTYTRTQMRESTTRSVAVPVLSDSKVEIMLEQQPRTISEASTVVLLNCVDDAIVVLGADMQIRFANAAATRLGGRPEGLLGDYSRLVHPDDLVLAIDAIQEAMDTGRSVVRLRLVLGSDERPVEIAMTNHLTTPGVDGIVACFRNLEAEVRLQSSLDRQSELQEHILEALTDELTGFPTRRLFVDRLGKELSESGAAASPVAVFFIDLDGFKEINDALGHTAGDAMLRATAAKLLAVHDEVRCWGRIGGDEFAVFVPGIDTDRAAVLAGQFSASMRRVMMLAGRGVHTSATIGIAIIDEADVRAEEALRRADLAMYEGKRRGRNLVNMFRPEMEERAVIQSELEGQLRATLAGSGPDVVFQPVVDMRTGRTIAVEALARWHSPTQGPIGPDRFVPIVERIGIVRQLSHHVVRKSCHAIRDLVEPESGLAIDLAVNISTQHLQQVDFADGIVEALEAHQLHPSRLIVEITESIAATGDADCLQQLSVLRALGVRVAIDDFGTGYSSLAQLEFLPVDILKVDQSFLKDITKRPNRLRFVESVVALAAALELRIVFEGVEHPDQARTLMNLGVEHAQGYLFGEPVGRRALPAQMARSRRVAESLRAGQTFQPELSIAAEQL
jgi:diguanylate cyclase (GGDEF)-like protein